MKNILIKGLFVSASIIFVTSSASAMACTNLTKALSKGSENSEVLKLQQFLFDSGYLTANPNGYFGAGTMNAVKKFQVANGISQVGSTGPVTRSKIKTLSCSKNTSNFKVKLDDTTLASSSGMNIKVKGSITIDDKTTFTESQLSQFKADMTQLYLKYQYQDVNVEPLKTEYAKQMDVVFLKDLGVDNVTTKNSGIFFYPEIGSILSSIKNKYPNQSEINKSSKASENGIILSEMNPTVVSISELSKYLSTPLTFKISNDSGVQKVCTKSFLLDSKGVDVFDPHEICNGYYGKNGIYSDTVYFSNFKSGISGSYETRGGKTYFENEGIDHEIVDFYVKDTTGKESNHLKFTFTK